MAPEPQHRQLLAAFLESLKETTSQVVQEENDDRKSLHPAVHASPQCGILDARIRNIQRDADMLQAAAALIEMQRTTLERQRARARNATQPCYRIPDEVLSYIFEVGVPVPSNQWDFNPRENEATRWIFEDHQLRLGSVAAVCSRFRTVILNTPRCWTYVVHRVEEAKRTSLEETETVLARSKGCGFSLELVTGMSLPPHYSLKVVSSVFLPHMHRCEQIFVTGSAELEDLVPILPSPLSVTLRSVQHVSIDMDGATDDDEELHKMGRGLVSLATATQRPLSSLTLGLLGYGPRHIAQYFSEIPMHALTRLWLCAHIAASDSIQILSRCIHLEHLHLGIYAEWMGTGMEPSTTTLDKLVSLQDESECVPCIRLIAPRLEQIELHMDCAIHILHPTQPALPSLQRLYLAVEMDYDEERLASFIYHHPGIIEFEIFCSPFTDENVTKLCAAIEVFIARPIVDADLQRAPHTRALRHITLFGVSAFADDGRVAASLGLVLRRLPNLRVELPEAWGSQSIKEIVDEFPACVTLLDDATTSASSTWPNAWGRWGGKD